MRKTDKEVKPIESLQVSDFNACPVWEYVNDDELGETVVRPVKRIPAVSLTGRVVATKVRLANGDLRWALLGNVDLENPRLTEHFLWISVIHKGKRFHLARYHDYDYAENGPHALAQFLGLGVDQVFPISYDISRYAKGDPAALVRKISKAPTSN